MREAGRRSEAWARLRFHLEMHEPADFWFALVVGQDTQGRVALREATAAWCAASGRELVELADAPPHDLSGLAVSLTSASGAALRWLRLDRDPSGWEEAAGELLLALNERRDAYRRHLAGGLVLEGPERLKVLLRNLAPDLFSVRACVIDLASEPLPVDRWSVEQPVLTSVDAPDPQDTVVDACRALDQARKLRDREGPSAQRARLSALDRGVEALITQGWVTEAEPAVEEMRALASEVALGHAERWAELKAEALRATAEAARSGARQDQAMLAASLAWTGEIAHAGGDLAAARDAWARSLAVRRGLAGEDAPPRPIDPASRSSWAAVARCLGELAELSLAAGDLTAAGAAVAEALSLRAALAASSPGDPEVRSEHALALSLAGDVAAAEGDWRLAREHVERALEIRRAVAGAHPRSSRYQRFLSVAWGRRARIAEAEGDRAMAWRARTEALRLSEVLAEQDPGNAAWQLELSVSFSQLAQLAAADGEAERARDAWRRALEIRGRLVEDDPDNARWQHFYGMAVGQLADLDLGEGRLSAARAGAIEALSVAEQLAWQDPAHLGWQIGLLRSRVRAGDAALRAGDRAEACGALRGALELAGRLEDQGVPRRRWEAHRDRARALWALTDVGQPSDS